VKALCILSAAVSLTDEVAYKLLKTFHPSDLPPERVLATLHASDFVFERNSEWHIRRDVREFLLVQLYQDRQLAESVHSSLLTIAKEADPSCAGQTIPCYFTWPAALAYHSALLNAEQALSLYVDGYTGRYTGDQWLLGDLAAEQQRQGLLPASAIEPAFLQGMNAYAEGRIAEARKLLGSVAESQEVRREVAIALHILGIIKDRVDHRPGEAEKFLRRSLHILEQLPDFHGQAQVLHTLGQLLWPSDRPEAEKFLRRSLHILEQLPDFHGQAQVLHTLGQLLWPSDRMEAERLLRRSLQIGEEIGHSFHQAQVLHTLGQLLWASDRTEAERLLRRSLRTSEEIGHMYSQAQVLHTLGQLLLPSDRTEAERLLRRSLQIGEEIGHSFHQAQVLHTLGQLLWASNQLEAERLLRRSLRIGEEIGHSHHQAHVLNTLANLNRYGGRWDQARLYYERVLQMSEHPKDLAVAHLGLSYVAERRDKDQSAAMKHMEMAIEYQKRTNRPDLTRKHIARLEQLKKQE
jgi:tetratricopeptide (TPR) repeat protein